MHTTKNLPADCWRHLLIFVGASGAGKDTVINAWLATFPAHERPRLARRVITRPCGDGTERHEAVDPSQWQALSAGGELAFEWRAHGLHYGVRWSELAPLRQGRWVVMNGSRAELPGLRQIASQATVVMVEASLHVRRARLRSRGREDAQDVRERLAREVDPVIADLVVHNDGSLEEAVAQLRAWWASRSP